MFSKKDIEQLKKKGIAPSEVEKQISFFLNGFPFLQLDRPATVNDGIIQLNEAEADKWAAFYDTEGFGITITKFVPASGAATRMFKDLYEFIEEPECESLTDLLSKYPTVAEVIEKKSEFAFYPELKKKYPKCESVSTVQETKGFIRMIISEKGLNYGCLPKGLLAFHSYHDGFRTSFEEHLSEGALYAKRDTGLSHTHFTVTPEHKDQFKKLLKSVEKKFEKLYDSMFDITFSEQSPSTDTVAVDMDNNPFRDNSGSMVFRPAGHGALLHNLNQLKSEVIFIKNIDNVVPDIIKGETIRYKKAIAGILIDNAYTIHDFLDKIDDGKYNSGLLSEIKDFYRMNFFVEIPDGISKDNIYSILNRPVRVCGMVRNQGEPGGGPFWVKGANGKSSLQIVESSQVGKGNAIFRNSTHFNPVDLVCYVYDHRGRKYDLPD